MSSSQTLEEMEAAIEAENQKPSQPKQKPMPKHRNRKVQAKPSVQNKVNPKHARLAAKSGSFCMLVDVHGIDRVMRMRGMSRRQVTMKYLKERDGVEKPKKPRKPKPNRGNK